MRSSDGPGGPVRWGPEDNALLSAPPLPAEPPEPASPADPGEVARAAREGCRLTPGERVLVAVSGGADSVALASLLALGGEHGLPLELVLAHLDHGWRGREEAQADRAVVEALAQRLRLPLVLAGPPEDAARSETKARRWRYSSLARLAREQGAVAVAVGHHLRDQAETVLMRSAAGSTPFGLRGMQPRRSLDGGRLAVVRPLLGLHPAALRAWNHSQGLSWREDPTNAGPGLRNLLRGWLVGFESRTHDPVRLLVALAERMRTTLGERAARLGERLEMSRGAGVPGAAASVRREALADLAVEDLALALRLLAEPLAADRAGPWLTGRHARACALVLARGGAVDMPHGITLRVTPKRAWLLRRRADLAARQLVVAVVPSEGFDLAAYCRQGSGFRAALDADVLGASPCLRPVREDDVFVPLGRGPVHPVNVLAWMRRRGVPRLARRGALVVEGARGVAWVPGMREDAAHAVREGTRRVAQLRIEAG